MTAIKHHRTGI